MTLDTLDWTTITRTQAVRLRPVAQRREAKAADKFNRDEISEADFLAASLLEENLNVFIHTGLKPGEH